MDGKVHTAWRKWIAKGKYRDQLPIKKLKGGSSLVVQLHCICTEFSTAEAP